MTINHLNDDVAGRFPRKEKYEDCNIPAAVFVYLVLLDFQYQGNYCVHFVNVV